jgi:DNA-binding transcriptional LysR family regulator
VELRHLRYFVAVAESLHFGQAASKLRIAQQSLSHQIRQLETELQTTLLRRTKRRVELTEAGRLFLDQARDILARADRAAVVARRVGPGDVPRLRIGVGFCMDQSDIAAAIGVYNATHADVHIELKTMSVPAQLSALHAASLDIGFVRPPISDPGLRSEVIVREQLVVALPPRFRFLRWRTSHSCCRPATWCLCFTMRCSACVAKPDSSRMHRTRRIICR